MMMSCRQVALLHDSFNRDCGMKFIAKIDPKEGSAHSNCWQSLQFLARLKAQMGSAMIKKSSELISKFLSDIF